MWKIEERAVGAGEPSMRLLWVLRAGWLAGGISIAVGLGVVGLAAARGADTAKTPAGASRDPDAYLRYVHPTVEGPYPDGVDLHVPKELGDRQSAGLGLVDVTEPPFGTDPSGKADSTKAIQAAVNFARDHTGLARATPRHISRHTGF
jgi:F0F1-type ATP synthase membrane subunit c/vacuolar-type H+-ATPase subunit K